MILASLVFLMWGSHLSCLGYRLLHLESFFNIRSFCPHCNKIIAWHDNIPVISWIYLQAQCRSCKQPISWLYPFIELITSLFLLALWNRVPIHYFSVYFLFFSALIITIRTDFEQMLISRFVTLYLIPIGYLAAQLGLLPISLASSISGSMFGYLILWSTKKIAHTITKQEALGQGDLELLAFIGTFTGPFGCWIALLIGSISGTFVSIALMMITKKSVTKVPFGSYLSFGAMIFVLFQKSFFLYF